MICLLNSVTESKNRVRVGVIHYKPERLSAGVRNAGIMVDKTEADLPRPEQRRGMTGVLYFNPATKAFWYEYVPRPLTQEELLEDLLSRLDETNARLDNLIARLEASRS